MKKEKRIINIEGKSLELDPDKLTVEEVKRYEESFEKQRRKFNEDLNLLRGWFNELGKIGDDKNKQMTELDHLTASRISTKLQALRDEVSVLLNEYGFFERRKEDQEAED